MENFKDIRWKQRFENYERAYETFARYVNLEVPTELERAGIIQLFEMSFELAWKVLKDYLENEGFLVNSPRETIKEAFRSGIISDGDLWLEALNSRNLSAHTYDEKNAIEAVENIREKYAPLLKSLRETLQERKERDM